MDKDYLQLILRLNECTQIAAHAAKNAFYMEQTFSGDDNIREYKDKLQRMAHELPYLIRRVSDLRQVLEEFNRIAMA